MRYAISDLHGNYNLLVKMLKKINFSKDDKLYLLGDIIDKGKDVKKLIDLICQNYQDNVLAICGNHEYEFIKFLNWLIKKDAGDEEILDECSKFLALSEQLSFEEIDFIKDMTFYVEEDEFVLVHAGVPLDKDANPIPLKDARIEDLVYDRQFANADILPQKCVIFGHTPTPYLIKKPEIIKYQKLNTVGNKPSDYYKIQIDTGNYFSGVLGCINLDNLQCFYVGQSENF